MKATKMTFQRLEKKYLLDPKQAQAFLERANDHLEMDEFGSSTICNIYFDTDHFELITNSLQKPPYKEKLRLRSYGIPKEDSIVFLEIKKKCSGVVNKRRVAMTLKEVKEYVYHGILPKQSSQILSEIDYFISFYQPQPKVFLAYDRVPMVEIGNSDLRITFDQNIRRRYDFLQLEHGDQGTHILPQGYTLMEIKVSDAYPMWLTHVLSDLKIYPKSFSKYGTVFMEDIVKKERGMLCSPVY